MTQDEIIRMAREVFVDIDIEGLTQPQALERFAALVAAHEREACANYGFCPICGSRGVSRERRINGNDTCENGHSYASNLALHITPEKQAEQVTEDNGSKVLLETEAQEPVAIMSPNKANIVGINAPHANIGTNGWIPLYAAPVRTKDLTDDEISKIWNDSSYGDSGIDFARAVIAADREKNK